MPLSTAQSCAEDGETQKLSLIFEALACVLIAQSTSKAKAFVDLRGTGLCIDCSFYMYGWNANGQSYFKEGVGRQMVAISAEGFPLPGGCGPRSAMLAHYQAWKFGSEPISMERFWNDFIPVVMKVDIASRWN